MIEKEKGVYELQIKIELDNDDLKTLERYGEIRNNNPHPSEENLKGYCEILLGGAIENLSKKYYEEEASEDLSALEKLDKKKTWEILKLLQEICHESDNCEDCPVDGMCRYAEQYPGNWILTDNPEDGIFKKE